MKYKLATILFAGVFAFSVVFTSILPLEKASAAGSGAGTQSTTETQDALDDLDDAATIAEVRAAVQDFLDQYNVTFSTSAVSADSIVGLAPSEDDLAATRNFSIEFIEEWSKYTTDWVEDSNLQTVYAADDIKVGGPSPSQKRCASFGNISNFMIYDVNCASAEPYMRRVIHHEYAHYLIFEKHNEYVFDSATWSSYNPAGFNYGTGGASTYGDSSFINKSHPQNGFVTSYAQTGLEEDQADVYGYLFTTSDYASLTEWILDDSHLAQKVTRLKAYIASVDATMNTGYFTDIHAYAEDSNTEIRAPFEGPGEQAYNPDGTLIWTIPADMTITSGIGIGGDPPFKQVLILDGTIEGGGHSSVTVGEGGKLMGTGKVELFIDVRTGGILAPGHSPGCLSSGDLILAGTYEAEIGGTTACTQYDQMKVTGTVDLTGGTLEASAYSSYVPKAGENYTIIENDGTDAVTGTFAGLAEGATFTIGGQVLRISYRGGSGNDVALSVVTVPTAPATGARLLLTNPLLILAIASSLAGVLFVVSRRVKA